MRGLTKKQKMILNSWYEKNKDNIRVGIVHFKLEKCPYFGYDLLDELEHINSFETIVQEINTYISEICMDKK
jgi:hypothetical protein